MSIVLQGATSGSITLQEPAVAGSNTLNLPAVTGTIVVAGQNSAITAGTAVNAATGSPTSVDFTSIPSWVKRITVMFNGVSTNGTGNYLIQLGVSGTPVTTGYSSTSGYMTTPVGAGTGGGTNSTSGFVIQSGATGYILYGSIVITNVSGNIWVAQGCFANIPVTALAITTAGGVSLSGTLNMVRITTNTGTETFDAGTINILYE